MQFSTNKSLHLTNNTRYRNSYYGRRIGTRMRSIQWCRDPQGRPHGVGRLPRAKCVETPRGHLPGVGRPPELCRDPQGRPPRCGKTSWAVSRPPGRPPRCGLTLLRPLANSGGGGRPPGLSHITLENIAHSSCVYVVLSHLPVIFSVNP